MCGAGSSGGDGCGHVVHGPEGDGVELATGGHRFDAIRPNLGGRQVEAADGFAEEASLLVLRFRKGDLNVRAEKSDGQPREASPGAEVEEAGGAGVQVLGGEEAFSEVAANDLLWIADRGEVSPGIPLEEQVQVGRELGEKGGGHFGRVRGQVRCEQSGNRGFG
jgi:hypothetical protein